MTELTQETIKKLVQSAEDLYYRLVLLVGMAGSGKTKILHDVALDFETKVVNLNLELSTELLELTRKQRSIRLPKILSDIANSASSIMVCDNLELLFNTELQQDPLRLLNSISRKRSVVASWNGRFDDGKLLYAEPGHPEYRSYDSVDALIVNVNGSATVKALRS